jgi:hypothetical protein
VLDDGQNSALKVGVLPHRGEMVVRYRARRQEEVLGAMCKLETPFLPLRCLVRLRVRQMCISPVRLQARNEVVDVRQLGPSGCNIARQHGGIRPNLLKVGLGL